MDLTVKPLNQWTACETAAAVARGEITPEAVVRACLDRIAERNDVIQAFVAFDPERALADARQAAQLAHAPLRGVPFAAKDILDSADYPTEYGLSLIHI